MGGRRTRISKPILQLDKDTGEILGEYASINEASEVLNIKPAGIYRYLIGYTTYAYKGFIWKYKEKEWYKEYVFTKK